MKFDFHDLLFGPHPAADGIHASKAFPNGFAVSVIRGSQSYGGPEGLFEVAILRVVQGGPAYEIAYDTGLTDDVIGHLDEDGVSEVMKRVQDLKRRSDA